MAAQFAGACDTWRWMLKLLTCVASVILLAAVPAGAKGTNTPPPKAEKKEVPPPPKPVSADELAIQYQRVGHALLELENHRGIELCADLMEEFRSIKLSTALQTPETRIAASAQLTQIALRIERLHGVDVSKACQNSPLAKECL